MIVTFAPQRRDERLTLERAGETLVVNGMVLDFGALAVGQTRPRSDLGCDWVVSDVTRQGGVIRLTLLLPHGSDAPPETLFPAPVEILVDGPVVLPPHGAVSDPQAQETAAAPFDL